MEALLPIGTVIMAQVEIGVAKLMIIGYLPKKKDTNKIYDYSAVLYPQGVDFNTNIFLVNRSMILKVIYEGYKDEATEQFITQFPMLIEKVTQVLDEHDNEKKTKE